MTPPSVDTPIGSSASLSAMHAHALPFHFQIPSVGQPSLSSVRCSVVPLPVSGRSEITEVIPAAGSSAQLATPRLLIPSM